MTREISYEPGWPIDFSPRTMPFEAMLEMMEAAARIQMQWLDAWSGLIAQVSPFKLDPDGHDHSEEASEPPLNAPPVGI